MYQGFGHIKLKTLLLLKMLQLQKWPNSKYLSTFTMVPNTFGNFNQDLKMFFLVIYYVGKLRTTSTFQKRIILPSPNRIMTSQKLIIKCQIRVTSSVIVIIRIWVLNLCSARQEFCFCMKYFKDFFI